MIGNGLVSITCFWLLKNYILKEILFLKKIVDHFNFKNIKNHIELRTVQTSLGKIEKWTNCMLKDWSPFFYSRDPRHPAAGCYRSIRRINRNWVRAPQEAQLKYYYSWRVQPYTGGLLSCASKSFLPLLSMMHWCLHSCRNSARLPAARFPGGIWCRMERILNRKLIF